MKTMLTLLAMTFCVSVANCQDLLYPGKYQVYKVTLKVSRKAEWPKFRDVRSWNVNLLLVTGGPSSVAIYNTVAGPFYRSTVGEPAYEVYSLSSQPTRTQGPDGIVTVSYVRPYYFGQIVPPAAEISNPKRASLATWRSTVSGNRSLNVEWERSEIDPETGYPMGIQDTYRLTFYCKAVK
ncbi:hypothetical protein F0P96_07795 [Hymenobacter busanensis]|uniref:Uncharacterized protein n=1 Tax=Hymenobacter busanensis TaxID=2607656 RepID=A0A7L5A184_9BACT|nr:hypothetical protein [Hymenobacter busanensis]KAA9338713.1 hypothetical protein F0P96_07795 [Hymenobacter busanensis]QHJ08856.1 hypothetical protein GUY19_16805 [Hymenobacter busanensis]